MKMTERYGSSGGGSNRKHKKHKTSTNNSASTPTKLLNNNGNSFDDNSLTTESSFTTNGQQQSSSTDNATKSLKLVLKVGQSGSYSPATSTTTASFLNNNIQYTDYNTDSIISGDSLNNNHLPTQSSPPPPPPPELLPLTVDSYNHNVDFTQINNTLKKSKKKKKKHHHHHHHGHGHHHSKSLTSIDNVPSTETNMTRNFVDIEGQNSNKKNNSIDHIVNNISSSSNNNEIVLNMKNSICKHPNSIIMVLDNQSQPHDSIEESSDATNMVKDDSQYSLSDKQTCLSINEPTVSSNNIHNNNDNELLGIDVDEEVEDEDAIMGSMLLNQDSIFSSVDLMDIDSCSKLDISALVPGDDELNDDVSQQSATSSLMSQYQLNQRPRAKLRPTSSIYRQLLQKGQVLCDSNNLYEHLRRQEKMSTSTKSVDLREKPSMFQKFLISLVERLRSKDVHRLFAWPVIDSLTPGYSQVICHPMDFHTIQKKIDHNLYRSVAELKFDVRLLCENAIRYYRHSGLHYKEASRLWYFAKTRVFARDQLAEHVKQFPPLTMIDLGMDDLSKLNSSTIDKIETTANDVVTSHPTTLHSLLNDTKCEPNLAAAENSIEEEPTAEQILENTKKSFRLLKADSSTDVPEFTLIAPRNDAVIFTRLRPDGTTTLPFVVSDENQTAEGITLGNLTGSLKEGTTALAPAVEPIAQRIKPCHYNEESLINPFSSHLPYIDSGSSTIDHHDTALLFETFEKYQPSKHSDEIERVANDQSYLEKSFVDSLLVTVSNGDYKPDENEVQLCNGKKHDANEIDDDPIETDLATKPIQDSLNQTKDLLERLNRVQSQRLMRTNEPIAPTNNEKEIAGKVTNSLVDIIKCWFKPADVIDQKTVHKQLGIVFKTEQSPVSDCPERFTDDNL